MHVKLRTAAAAFLALVTLALAGLGSTTVMGLSQEYGQGTGLQALSLLMGVAGLLAMLTVVVWPGARGTGAAAVVLGFLVVLFLVGLAADRIGAGLGERDDLAASAAMGCNNRNSEVLVDERVDAVFAELPRRDPLYGPVEGTRHGCTAAVDGEGQESFEEYADAFRELDGWRVRTDEPGRFVMDRDGVRVSLGMSDGLAMLTVEVTGA